MKILLSIIIFILVKLSYLTGQFANNPSWPHLNESIYELETNAIPPTPIEPSCLSYYSYLAKIGSLFTQCVVNYSRPFRVCQNCLKYYIEIKDAKNLIQNVRLILKK